MKIKNIIILLSFLVIAVSCQKDRDEVAVTYSIKGLAQDYKVSYLNEAGETITETVSPGSISHVWTYNFKGVPGDLVYLYAKYYDKDPAMGTFRFMIKVDDKMHKYADGYDKTQGDTIFEVKRAGVIPF
ncbi:MAG: hypothetical protein K9J13_17225 [Saprospiraceae bacterium]|nr:hypothetical protein [Saprospiraceae bacterium]